MGVIRPELAIRLRPWREVMAAAVVCAGGAWIATWGGWFWALCGAVMALLAGAWALGAIRRLAFRRDVAAPGVVEIDEGAIRYLAPRALGGQIALRELAEIRLLRLNGHDHWRLKSADGQALLIPVEAAGAGGLADAFAALPGIDMGRVASALSARTGPSLRVVWSRR